MSKLLRKPILSHEEAFKRATVIVDEMSLNEKIDYIGGHNYFFINSVEKHNIPRLYLVDATQGVHLRKDLDKQLEKSTAFPAPIALASTWNINLSYKYAYSIGEECRAGDMAVLLGPGMNIYRNSQNGRNFEYFGEDPFLAASFIGKYVTGMQDTGTIATLKHFACNNTDYYRRTSNSIVDERTMHEIYLPAFKAGIGAGAMAVMTAYNQVNGEWAGQSKQLINNILRKQLGFKWLVMTDWWSIWDPAKAIASGLDLDMPGHGRKSINDFEDFGNPFLRSNAAELVANKKVNEADITRMATNVIATSIAMGLNTRKVKDESLLNNFNEHVTIALQTAREGIVLLKNNNNILPISNKTKNSVLLTGMFVEKIAFGKGAAEVEGYNNITMKSALEEELGNAISYIKEPTDNDFKNADIVLLSIGTFDSEGWDSPFDLSTEINNLVVKATKNNSNVIVIMNSGRGVGMTPWIDSVAGLIYAWYPGQIGNKALAEIISGACNPSGKLPITIEKDFKDSPAYPYIPKELGFYEGWDNDFKIDLPIQNIEYKEGVFVGYRWYEEKNIEPLFNFGFGLSYTEFEYSNIKLSSPTIKKDNFITVSFTLTNTGKVSGAEVCQLYIKDVVASVERPKKELKGFAKVFLEPSESKTVEIELQTQDLAFYNATIHKWEAEAGEFIIYVGGSSINLPLNSMLVME